MILATAAKAIKWRSYEEVGNGGEFDFSLRLAIKYQSFFFLDKYTAKYRLCEFSMTRNLNDDAASQSFNIILHTDFPDYLSSAKDYELKREAPIAIIQLINSGKKKQALDIYFSKYHPLSKRLSLGGFRRLLKAVLPQLIGKFI
jgi:hypothetical protein